MQQIVKIYESNAPLIQQFVRTSLAQLDIDHYDQETIQELFEAFPSLELLYCADLELLQNSPNFFRERVDSSQIGKSRRYLLKGEGDSISFHAPYLSKTTNHLCITVIVKKKSGYLFLDFQLRQLLERFNLIESRLGFGMVSKVSYSIIGGGLLFFGLFLTLYGFYNFAIYLFDQNVLLSLESVFKPIIALTLGLAVFDLGKTIIEQEVLLKSENKKSTFNVHTLLNFSASIIIALLIEALLIVFKISLSDYTELTYAATLIASLSLLIAAFAIFVYFTRRKEEDRHD